MSNQYKIAILMLACRDYEAMELALACHTAYGQPEIPIYVLQNCRGNYDAERTLEVAQRYARLFPKQVHVIDHIAPQAAYHSIAELLNSNIFNPYDLVCKVDDDAFPITSDWLAKLIKCWRESEARYGDKLAYVTPLINNNNWGFVETIEALGLEEVYFSTMAREHYAGVDNAYGRRRLLPANEIATGVDGTIWGLPYLARWIHEQTTLQPERFIEATAELAPKPIPSADRYSIGCILFRKSLWNAINDGGNDDEHMMHMYCRKRNLMIISERSVPFIHIAYFSQREENRDIVEKAKAVYAERLQLPFPISLRQTRQLEIEARLRWLETNTITGSALGAPVNGLAANGLANMSAEMLGVHAFKGIIKAILYKLGLRKTPPR
ncbi:hypothetical protein [Pseudochrobactrum sp. HB0163]|uniref:hypothetical protein n=1 Tax=Pseudochrobactrum sp. HB0163 TaxID=3450708 RepID=UPI003F6E3F8D